MQGKFGTFFPGLYTHFSRFLQLGHHWKGKLTSFPVKPKWQWYCNKISYFVLFFLDNPRCAPTANMFLPQTLEGNVVPPVYALNKRHQSSEKKQPDLPNLTEFVEIKRWGTFLKPMTFIKLVDLICRPAVLLFAFHLDFSWVLLWCCKVGTGWPDRDSYWNSMFLINLSSK